MMAWAIITSHNHTMPFTCIGEALSDVGQGIGRVLVQKSYNLLDIPLLQANGLFQYPIAWEKQPDRLTGLGGIMQYRKGYVGELVFHHNHAAKVVYEHFSVAFQLTLHGLRQRGLLQAGKKSTGGLILPSMVGGLPASR